MANDGLYQVTLRNLPFEQARSLYRFLVNLDDEEPMVGGAAMSWSGIIPGDRNRSRPERTVTIDPMPTHERVTRERDMREMVRRLNEYVRRNYVANTHPSLRNMVARLADRAEGKHSG